MFLFTHDTRYYFFLKKVNYIKRVFFISADILAQILTDDEVSYLSSKGGTSKQTVEVGIQTELHDDLVDTKIKEDSDTSICSNSRNREEAPSERFGNQVNEIKTECLSPGSEIEMEELNAYNTLNANIVNTERGESVTKLRKHRSRKTRDYASFEEPSESDCQKVEEDYSEYYDAETDEDEPLSSKDDDNDFKPNKSTTKNNKLANHLEPTKANDAELAYQVYLKFLRHKTEVTEVFSCHMCIYRGLPSKLMNHIETKHEGSYQYACIKCSLPFYCEKMYNQHFPCTSSLPQAHTCVLCPDSRFFGNTDNLMMHLEKYHEGVMPLACDRKGCETKVGSPFQQQQHICQIHQHSLSFCEVCQVLYETLEEYQFHIANDHFANESPYKCHICQELCIKKQNNSNHVTNHIALNKDVCVCSFCGRKFYFKHKLVSHMKNNCGKQLQCDKCKKRYSSEKGYKKHIEVCKGDKFLCEKCCKVCIGRNSLKLHLSNVHNEGKDFPCRTCGKKFYSLISVSRHEKTHLTDKPYKCSYCDKQFASAWNRKAHERQHTNEKPYTCEKCGQGFTHNVVRKTHQEKCFSSDFQTYQAI